MNKEYFKKYLEERYRDQMNWYDKKAIHNQKLFVYYQWSLIILTAITPVLIITTGGLLKWIAAGIAALIAMGTSALKIFKYQEKWVNYRTTCETLKKEIYYYKSRLKGYKEAESPESLFVNRVETLISRENTYWMTTAEKEEGKD